MLISSFFVECRNWIDCDCDRNPTSVDASLARPEQSQALDKFTRGMPVAGFAILSSTVTNDFEKDLFYFGNTV
jgi:hypothetical protein